MLNLDILEKGLEIASPPHFVYDFFKKIFVVLYSINQISLSGCLYFLRYLAICVLQLLVYHVVTS